MWVEGYCAVCGAGSRSHADLLWNCKVPVNCFADYANCLTSASSSFISLSISSGKIH